MKTHDLRTEDHSGGNDASQLRYIIDDKRVAREAYDAVRRQAVRMDTFETARVNGVVKQYCVAYTP